MALRRRLPLRLLNRGKRYEFDMENQNMKGHWTGLFNVTPDGTEIDFTEDVTAKKALMKPFVGAYLKKTAETVCGRFEGISRMIEILFGESEAGGVTIARAMQKPGSADQVVELFLTWTWAISAEVF